MEHTPTPWKVEDCGRIKAGNLYIAYAQGFTKGFGGSYTMDDAKANAAFIVKACNLYPEMVEVIQGLLSSVAFGDMGVFHDKPYYLLGDGDPVIKKAKAILQRLALP